MVLHEYRTTALMWMSTKVLTMNFRIPYKKQKIFLGTELLSC